MGESMITGLPDDDKLKALVVDAFSEWAPGATVQLNPLSGGYSGSTLFKADVRHSKDKIAPGVHILKLSPPSPWPDDAPEFQAHSRSFERNPEFAKEHLPPLIASFPQEFAAVRERGYAMLFEIAGGSLDRFAPADEREDGNFQKCAGSITEALLFAWADPEPGVDTTPADLMLDLCGYRLTDTDAPRLHQFVAGYCAELLFIEGGEVLINPLRFVGLLGEQNLESAPTLRGLVHGDLHGGNILLHRARPGEHPFYVIDFALAREGVVGYDAAYLELSHALAALGDEDPAFLIGALRAAEDPDDPHPPPGRAFWTKSVIEDMRAALLRWRTQAQPHRADQIDRQFALCRVAAGINWANKPIRDSWRIAALCYAGWAARRYLQDHEPALWASLTSKSKKATAAERGDDELWNELWQATSGFRPRPRKVYSCCRAA